MPSHCLLYLAGTAMEMKSISTRLKSMFTLNLRRTAAGAGVALPVMHVARNEFQPHSQKCRSVVSLLWRAKKIKCGGRDYQC